MINEKYSYKNFSSKSFIDVSPLEFNGKGDIVNSDFSQEILESEPVEMKSIFPAGISGVRFIGGNYDNVKIPETCELLHNDQQGTLCSNKLIKECNDRHNWEFDKNTKKPKEPIDKNRFVLFGISTDPKDIPIKKLTHSRLAQRQEDIEKSKPNPHITTDWNNIKNIKEKGIK